MSSGQPPLGATSYGNLPSSGHVFGAQAHGVSATTAAPPGRPDFEPFFGKPMREIKTNPYEGCVSPPLYVCSGARSGGCGLDGGGNGGGDGGGRR
jgi:hypothetical protein